MSVEVPEYVTLFVVTEQAIPAAVGESALPPQAVV